MAEQTARGRYRWGEKLLLKPFLITIFIAPLLFLSGCSARKTQQPIDAAAVKVPWASVPGIVQSATDAAAGLYGQGQVSNGQVIQTWSDDSIHQKMYVVTIVGKFHNGKIDAEKLSFSVLADGSKIWALGAFDDKGKVIWQQDNFTVKQENLRFEGKSAFWQGSYSVEATQIWTKGFANYGSWESDQFDLSYLRRTQKIVKLLKYVVSTGAGGCRETVADADLSHGFGCGGAGNGAIPSEDSVIKAAVSWDGQSETLSLRNPKSKK